MPKQLERRKSARFTPKCKAFVIIKNYLKKEFDILDISREGIAFLYDDIKEGMDINNELELAIVSDGFRLDKLKCKVASLILPNENDARTPQKARLGVIFKKPSFAQKSKIYKFILKYTVIQPNVYQSHIEEEEESDICITKIPPLGENLFTFY